VLDLTFTQPVSAIGFDVVRASYGPIPAGSPMSPTDVNFSFGTVSGLQVSVTAAPGSFMGALLIDDVFSNRATLRAIHPQDNPYFADFAIDNLAVRSVPEPSTGVLLSVAAVLVGVLRRQSSRA
jgi:hypothetical protein